MSFERTQKRKELKTNVESSDRKRVPINLVFGFCLSLSHGMVWEKNGVRKVTHILDETKKKHFSMNAFENFRKRSRMKRSTGCHIPYVFPDCSHPIIHDRLGRFLKHTVLDIKKRERSIQWNTFEIKLVGNAEHCLKNV